MKIILLSGGSGKRLWPLSNDIRSKQFIKILTTSDGQKESMIQRTIRYISRFCNPEDILITTSLSQVEILESQLGSEFSIISEPHRRDTLPAIYLACMYFSYIGVPKDEPIIVLPCDSYTEAEFYKSLSKIVKVINDNIAEMVLVGIKPTYPSSKYGYIVPQKCKIDDPGIIPIEKFIEKPDIEEAEYLIDEGAFWNGGVYGFKLQYLLDLGIDKFRISNYQSLLTRYLELPKLNFSYEILQKAKNQVVIPYSGRWNDIGTWNALAKELVSNEIGNVLSADCCDTLIINEKEEPLVCVGCKDMVVVASTEGILVADKDKSENIKRLLADINSDKNIQ